MPKIWIACYDHTPKILNLKSRRGVIVHGGTCCFTCTILLYCFYRKTGIPPRPSCSVAEYLVSGSLSNRDLKMTGLKDSFGDDLWRRTAPIPVKLASTTNSMSLSRDSLVNNDFSFSNACFWETPQSNRLLIASRSAKFHYILPFLGKSGVLLLWLVHQLLGDS